MGGVLDFESRSEPVSCLKLANGPGAFSVWRLLAHGAMGPFHVDQASRAVAYDLPCCCRQTGLGTLVGSSFKVFAQVCEVKSTYYTQAEGFFEMRHYASQLRCGLMVYTLETAAGGWSEGTCSIAMWLDRQRRRSRKDFWQSSDGAFGQDCCCEAAWYSVFPM